MNESITIEHADQMIRDIDIVLSFIRTMHRIGLLSKYGQDCIMARLDYGITLPTPIKLY